MAALKAASMDEIEKIALIDPLKAFSLYIWRKTCLALDAKYSEKNDAADKILAHTAGKPVQRVEQSGQTSIRIIAPWMERVNEEKRALGNGRS